KETDIKINEIITSHLNINITKTENFTTIEKLDTILNIIKSKVKECLKLLGIPFQTGDSLMSMLNKLVSFSEEMGITTPVQENLLRCLRMLNPKTKSSNSKTESLNMDALVKACYEKSRYIINKESFEKNPEISFVRKLMRCHYYLVGKSNPLSVKTMAENLFKITDLEYQKTWNKKI
ncbi:2093_t:CDS:1, partial [Cetraspora pellucida]